MNIENITKEELGLIVEALGGYHPKPDLAGMLQLAMKAKLEGAETPEAAYEQVKNLPEMKKIEREHDRKQAGLLNLKLKLSEVLDRAGEFEVPDPSSEKK